MVCAECDRGDAGEDPGRLRGGVTLQDHWDVLNAQGNLPIFSSRQKWSYAAIANFIAGVMPPSAMLGRSWLYVHSHRVALSCTCSIVSNRVWASQP